MANIDRLVNHQDALDIIDKLKVIGYNLNPETNPLSWKNISDTDLATVMQQAYEGTIDPHIDLGWCVGDERKVHLNAISAGTYNYDHPAQDVTLVLMDTDHYYLADGVTKCKYVVGMKDVLTPYAKATYFGQDNTKTAADTGANGVTLDQCLTAIFNGMFPSGIKGLFKSFKCGCASYGAYTDIDATFTKLSLFSLKELGFNTSYGYSSSRDSAIEYYKTSSNRKKNTNYNTRSISATNTNPGYRVLSNVDTNGNPTSTYSYASESGYFSPFGVI